MNLDIRTLGLCLAVGFFVQAAMLFAQYRFTRTDRGFGTLVVGFVLLSIGFLLNILRDAPGIGVFAVFGNNLFFFAACVLYLAGALRFLGRPFPRAPILTFAASALVLSAFFTFVRPDILARTLVLSLTVGLLMAATAGALFRHKTPDLRGSATLLASVFALAGGFFLFRAAYLARGGAVDGFFTPSAMQTATYLLVFISSLLWTFGFSVMQNQRLDGQRRRAEGEIRALARQLETERDAALSDSRTDALTSVANRRHFNESLAREFQRHQRSGEPLSLLLLDIDHFKKFNDRYGHLAGDECLRRVAGALRSVVLRVPDVVARYGGEEFAVILPETDDAGALALGERIRRAVEGLAIPHEASATAEVVTISLGCVTLRPTGFEEAAELIALADKALYRAKRDGRNRILAVSPEELAARREAPAPASFARLVWSPAHECEIPAIDGQHRGLFETSNLLLAAVIGDRPKEESGPLIRRLVAEVEGHFTDEEALLRAHGYPGVEAHARCHAELYARVTELSRQYERGEFSLGDFFRFLAYDLVAQHFMAEDRKYLPWLRGKR
ncbi:MAG: diguanylate cyclase [Spirochaetes bacterium]|nr:diguanylate cyclase [Spirochaetota bacterium]